MNYLTAMRRYFDFSGRSSRSEYWLFVLVFIVGYVVFGIGMGMAVDDSKVGVLLFAAWVIAHLIPMVSVGVRRLHDTGYSGWWILLNLIPFIGPLIVLYLSVQPSQPGTNLFGPNPHEAATTATVAA